MNEMNFRRVEGRSKGIHGKIRRKNEADRTRVN
jgi:hypothetical protein